MSELAMSAKALPAATLIHCMPRVSSKCRTAWKPDAASALRSHRTSWRSWACSSVGQSGGLIIRWSQVRVLPGPPNRNTDRYSKCEAATRHRCEHFVGEQPGSGITLNLDDAALVGCNALERTLHPCGRTPRESPSPNHLRAPSALATAVVDNQLTMADIPFGALCQRLIPGRSGRLSLARISHQVAAPISR